MTSQHLTFSYSAVLWLIERSEDDRNFFVPSYTRTPVIPKELLMISAYIFCTLWFDAVKCVWRNALVSLLPNIKEIDSQVWKNFVHLSNFYFILWAKGRRMLNWSLKFILLIDWWAWFLYKLGECKIKSNAWIIYFRWIVKNSTVMHVGGNFYVICLVFFPADFEFQHSNFKIRCPYLWG